jgi:N-acetyl-gamma-glutamyl-phosphate reductase
VALKVAIIGASGYTGLELLRLLLRHPHAEVVAATSRREEGKPLADIFPLLAGQTNLRFVAPQAPEVFAADLVFAALPHQAAMAAIPALLAQGKRVVDLSADFRLRDAAVYEQWYGPHEAVAFLAQAVYGLPELRGAEVASARLVANPGCYPTATLLGLAPLLAKGLIDPDTIIVDAKSGVSGAGRGLTLGSLFCEANEGLKAYKVGEHRHTPEMEQEMSWLAGKPVTITFTPHLVPLSRGMLATTYARLSAKVTEDDIRSLYQEFYAGKPFVRLCPAGATPNALFVRGSNFCDVGLKHDLRTGRIIAMSAIDNLVKGASGQAVQNMNIMCGFPERAGLEALPLAP